MITAIINRNYQYGLLNGVILRNSEILKIVNECLKKRCAKKLIDTEDTLMYKLWK